MPEATRRRSPVPALLAAAAVLAVLAGVLYGVNRAGRPDQVPPATGSTAASAPTDDGDIWGAAILAVARRFQPAGVQWEMVRVLSYPMHRPPDKMPSLGATFSAAEKARIERAVRPLAPVVWNGTESPVSCAPGRDPIIAVDVIADKGDHQEVGVVFIRGCGETHTVTAHLEKVGGVWKVTVLCPNEGTEANPQPGC